MPTELKMPQLGESVHEGTISRWLKQPGDRVEKYEPLLEVATDKVETEVTAPEGGVVQQILVPEGETVRVGTLLATIGEAVQVVAPVAAELREAAAPAAPTPATPPAPTTPAAGGAPRVSPLAAKIAQDAGVAVETVQGSGPGGQVTKEDVLRAARERGNGGSRPPAVEAGPVVDTGSGQRSVGGFLSPRVQMLARQLGVDLGQVQGTGREGRITARDVEEFAARQTQTAFRPPAAPQPAPPAAAPAPTPAAPVAPLAPSPAMAAPEPMAAEGLDLMAGDELTPLSGMRRLIAEHMVRSKQTAPHVTTVHEADVTRMVRFFKDHFDPFRQREGFNLTYTPFFVQAVVNALRAYPGVNVSFTEQGIIQRKALNIGMAVALADGGLIVPVIKAAEEKTLTRLARDVTDLATRARARKLTADETRGGTFTISNYGVFGSLFGTPVINQSQAAILGVGAVKKRPVVVEDEMGETIAIRSLVYLALTFDHRAFDGSLADQFMQRVVRELEHGPWSL